MAASPAQNPVIVADSVSGEVEAFLDDFGADRIYTLGFDSGMNESYRIEPGDVPGLFFPNHTKAVYVDEREKGILGSWLAYNMGIPVVFSKEGYPEEVLIDTSVLGEEGIREMGVSESGGNIDYLVLANTVNQSSLLAGRLAGMRGGYPVLVDVEGVGYEGEPQEVNDGNRVVEVMESLQEAVQELSGRGMFTRSGYFLRGGNLFLGILGDGYAVPHALVHDPGMEVLDDRDGAFLKTDIFYSDINQDGRYDLAAGRLSGNLTSISLQMERFELPKSREAVLIGQYRHPKHGDLMAFGGGMMQAYIAEWALDRTGLETRRVIENRTEPGVSLGMKGMFDMAMHRYGLGSRGGLGAALSAVSWAWASAELGEKYLYALLEYEWGGWLERVKQGELGFPEQLEVFYPDTGLGQPGLLAYFGLGEDGWIVPPDDRDEFELLTSPYGRAAPYSMPDFHGFLYDDRAMSAWSGIAGQVLSLGGMVAGPTGLVHDPQAIYYSSDFFTALSEGKPAGEALREAANGILPENPLTLADYMVSEGVAPNLLLKERLGRILLGDPSFSPVQEGVPRKGDSFTIRPYRSFLASETIMPDYVVRRGVLNVRNADSWLAESGKPLVPIFERELILPEGASVQDVRFRGFYRTYRHLDRMTVPWDHHYPEGEAFEGRYPERRYWFTENGLLDGRTLVRVAIPAVIHGERRSRVLSWGRLYLEYESPLEMAVKARDVRKGLTEKIKVTLWNEGEEIEGTLWLWAGNETFSRNITLKEGKTRERFSFTPQEAGNYQARAVFESEQSVGPRYSDFRAWEPCGKPCWRLPFWLRLMFRPFCREGCCDSLGNLAEALKGKGRVY